MRILVANRGEIAHRINKTIHSLGFEIVAVYHPDEKNAAHVSEADFAVNLGTGSLQETFLNSDLLIKIAREYNCDALHPGYGFLSENPVLAKACEQNNIKFIGPSSEVIRLMGSKIKSKEVALLSGLPVLAYQKIASIGQADFSGITFPVLIKSSGGGGGKGMRICSSEEVFHQQFNEAKHESIQYFGSDEMLIEPYLENARHIEVQLLGDEMGNVVHLFDRECSIQRNYQKLVEEAPTSHLDNDLRQSMLNSAVGLAKGLNYTNAGTVEFLVQGNNFYFLEMNTRIQVEHPVTELITGIDIVAEQINIAMGNPLPEYLYNIQVNGHAIEARIYAEDPYLKFLPSAGTILYNKFPKDVRIDTFIQSPTHISTLFDSLLAKTISHATNRSGAIEKLYKALNESVILGVNTNIDYLCRILHEDTFVKNIHNTSFLKLKQKSFETAYFSGKENFDIHLLAIAFMLNNFAYSDNPNNNLWKKSGIDFRNRSFLIMINSLEIIVTVHALKNGFVFRVNDVIYSVSNIVRGDAEIEFKTETGLYNFYYAETDNQFDFYQTDKKNYRISSPQLLSMAAQFITKKRQNEKNKINQIVSPLFGKVIDIKVNVQDFVRKGDVLLTIESMKTENHIVSPGDGVVKDILVKLGGQVKENVELITMNPF